MPLSPIPQVRRPGFAFGPEVGRHWFGGSVVLTHLANGLLFVFPQGERFFIRSVRRYLDRVQDPSLRARVAAFAGQEAQHERAHLASFAALEAAGYEVESWMRWYRATAMEGLEPRVPPVLRLSTTAALEHFTATFGELALRTEMLDDAHPTMRALLRWHAAEEIEHRDVAFDVLLTVDPRWFVRFVGFAMAGVLLLYFWRSGTRHLMRQEPPRDAARRSADAQSRARVRAFWRAHGPGFAAALLAYLRPRFHPRDAGGDALAERYFAEEGAVAK